MASAVRTIAARVMRGAYTVVFGGLLLVFGAAADRFGRRRVMLLGLVLLASASLASVVVSTAEQLIVVRAVMGIAAAMTTPGSMALAFRLFGDDDGLRVRATTFISTVGLVGLAIGPTVGGFVLAIAPWQVLLLANVPIAALAFAGVRFGIDADHPADLHRDPVDVIGALGCPPALAAIGMLPQVVVLIGGGALISPFVQRVGLDRAAWLSAVAVVCGLAIYGLLSSLGYIWVALALVLVAAGLRVVGVVAATNVLRGLPTNRTTIDVALTDTVTEVTSGVGLAITGTIVAGLFNGDIATSTCSVEQTREFQTAVSLAGLVLTAVAAVLVSWCIMRMQMPRVVSPAVH
jgi:MFS family permease